MRIPRPIRIAFLVNEEEAAKLRELARKEGITVADLLRRWLKAAKPK